MQRYRDLRRRIKVYDVDLLDKSYLDYHLEFVTSWSIPALVGFVIFEDGTTIESCRIPESTQLHSSVEATGVGVKGMTKSVPVWRIDGSAQTLLPKEDFGKSYSGDCYIVRYTYPAGDREKGYFECCWFGKDSIEEDQKTAYKFSERMFNSCKGRGVQGRIFQGEEPPQFVKLFQPMVVLKGGLSSGYKKFITDKGLTDETYKADSAARSLNSMDCFFLQSGSSIFTWHGKQCTFEQQHLAAKVAEFLKPGVALQHANEGKESQSFWRALGGKQSYTSKKVAQEIVRDPHLFKYSFNKGIIPPSVESQRKKAAFKIGQKYIEMAASSEQFGLSSNVPLYTVFEGNEPCFFRTYFSWNMLDLSSDLICEILCPLPIKELFQCLCLSKECYAQIHHWDFIKKHLDASREPPIYVIKTFNKYFSIPFLHNDQFGVPVEIDRPHNVHDDSSIIACCDGLVLVRNTKELFIWKCLSEGARTFQFLNYRSKNLEIIQYASTLDMI
ncbi:villin-2-like isoform X2 [Fagus crenata]